MAIFLLKHRGEGRRQHGILRELTDGLIPVGSHLDRIVDRSRGLLLEVGPGDAALFQADSRPPHDAPAPAEAPERIPQQAVFDARREIGQVHVSDAIGRYMADLVYATRTPEKYSEDLARWIDVGGSPRASLALDKCSRTHAWLSGRDYVDPDDVRAIVHDCLRHRLMLSYEAQGEGVRADQVVDAIVEQVALP